MTELMTNEPVKRGPGRPPLHVEDPRARAKARAAELLDQISQVDDTTDIFYIPASAIPEGWIYEWKRYSTHNQVDSEHISEMRRRGWEFVPAKRHPEMVAIGSEKDEWIFRRGNVLMEIPEEVYAVFKEREGKSALTQMEVRGEALKGKLPSGFAMDNQGDAISVRGVKSGTARKSWAPMPVPER